MKTKALERFTRNLLRLLGRTEPARACLGEATLAALAGGERLPGGARRRALRHAARCPACLEKVILLREIAGEEAPLFQPLATRFRWHPAWRPLASAAALVVVAGLLYLGGITLQRLSHKEAAELAHLPAAPPPVAQTAPETTPAPTEGFSGPAASRTAPAGGGAADRDRIARKAEADKTAPAAKERQEAPPPVTSAVEDARLNEFAPEPASRPPSVRMEPSKDQAVRDTETAETEMKAKAAPAPPPAPAAAAAAPAEESRLADRNRTVDEAAGRLAARQEHPKGAEADPAARLDALCRAASSGDPEVYWRGRRFRLIRGELVQDGVCEALGRRPVERARPEEAARLRRSPGYDPAWRAVWLLTPDAIVLAE